MFGEGYLFQLHLYACLHLSSCSPQQQPISLEFVSNSILLLGATKPFTLDLEYIFEQYGMENVNGKFTFNKNLHLTKI